MYKQYIKPCLDKGFALILLIVLLPLLLLVSFVIIIKMGRPLLFRQERPGKDEKIFTIYKFRTMGIDYDARGVLLSDEKRLNGVGKVIRALSLDELPQLINVLKGEMSFIGPRPLLVEYLDLYDEEQKQRHKVKPGISGLAQVNGRNSISWKEKLAYDISYTKEISFLLDMKILVKTIQKVFLRKDISGKEHATSEKFNGHN